MAETGNLIRRGLLFVFWPNKGALSGTRQERDEPGRWSRSGFRRCAELFGSISEYRPTPSRLLRESDTGQSLRSASVPRSTHNDFSRRLTRFSPQSLSLYIPAIYRQFSPKTLCCRRIFAL